MKKINSIGYGGKILGCAAVFLLILPGILCIIQFIFESDTLLFYTKVSFGIGVIITLFFMGLLAVELHQDKQINRYYKTQKDRKLNSGKGSCECQACGNRAVKVDDKNCGICGITFKEKDESDSVYK